MCCTAIEPSDSARAERFAGRMIGLVNDSFLSVLVSIGHRTRLFETMAGLAPSTSDEVARAAGLEERYVREWLGAMVCGKIVDYDGARRTYWLPPEHASVLTRAAGADNLAMFTQYVALAAGVEDDVVDCFQRGGGVPYARFGRFQELQAEESAMVYGDKLVATILPLAPGLVERLREGARVLDVGCGQGHAVNVMAREFPRSHFVGHDFSAEGIAAARGEAAALGLANARFEVVDVATLEGGAFDLVTAFDVVHDLARPAEVLRAIRGALGPGGTFLCIDIAASSNLADNVDHPLGPFLYAASTLHCMTVSLAQGGPGLGTVWGEELAQRMLREAGFSDVAVRHIDGDPIHAYYVAR